MIVYTGCLNMYSNLSLTCWQEMALDILDCVFLMECVWETYACVLGVANIEVRNSNTYLSSADWVLLSQTWLAENHSYVFGHILLKDLLFEFFLCQKIGFQLKRSAIQHNNIPVCFLCKVCELLLSHLWMFQHIKAL